MLFGGLFLVSVVYQMAAARLLGSFLARQRRGEPLREPETPPSFAVVKPLHRFTEETARGLESLRADMASSELRGLVYLCSQQPPPAEVAQWPPDWVWQRSTRSSALNAKAAILADCQAHWEGDILIVSDADMMVAPGYLRAVLDEFSDPEVGVVTCLYRSSDPPPGGWGHLFEALCIADFAASVTVAIRTEKMAFAMGSTMAIRRRTLEQMGGFEALEPYLADDFQLGFRAAQAGWKVRLAGTVLETDFPGTRLRDALSHQYRWLVTSRVSRPGGHAAFLVTQGLFWALCLSFCRWPLGLLALGTWAILRTAVMSRLLGSLGGGGGTRAGRLRHALWAPIKDALYLVLWFGSLFGAKVRWGERELTIDSQGRIVEAV